MGTRGAGGGWGEGEVFLWVGFDFGWFWTLGWPYNGVLWVIRS
jgi:hypothetical protein